MGSVEILQILRKAAKLAMDNDDDALFYDICAVALHLAREKIVHREDMRLIFENKED